MNEISPKIEAHELMEEWPVAALQNSVVKGNDIPNEAVWQKTFHDSEEMLIAMAVEAAAEYEEGLTQPLGNRSAKS